MRRLKVIYLAIRHSVLDLCFIYWITRRLDVRRMIWCVTDLKIAFTHTHTHTHTYIYIYIYIYTYEYTGMSRLRTFRSKTDGV